MNRILLIFILLSSTAHALIMTGLQYPDEQSGQGSDLRVSLLSGVPQSSKPETKQNPGSVNSKHNKQKNDQKKISPAMEREAQSLLGAKNVQPHIEDNKQKGSISSTAQPASNLKSGKIIVQEFQKLLTAKFAYPVLAQKYGYQGQVIVKVRIQSNGDIQNARLLKSSGYRILDLAALKSIRDINKAPQLKQWLQGRSASINVPVSYQLIET